MPKPQPLLKSVFEAKQLGLQTLASAWKLPPKKKRGRRSKKKGNVSCDRIIVKPLVTKAAPTRPRKQTIKTKKKANHVKQPRTDWNKGENLEVLSSAVTEWLSKKGRYYNKKGKARSLVDFCAIVHSIHNKWNIFDVIYSPNGLVARFDAIRKPLH